MAALTDACAIVLLSQPTSMRTLLVVVAFFVAGAVLITLLISANRRVAQLEHAQAESAAAASKAAARIAQLEGALASATAENRQLRAAVNIHSAQFVARIEGSHVSSGAHPQRLRLALLATLSLENGQVIYMTNPDLACTYTPFDVARTVVECAFESNGRELLGKPLSYLQQVAAFTIRRPDLFVAAGAGFDPTGLPANLRLVLNGITFPLGEVAAAPDAAVNRANRYDVRMLFAKFYERYLAELSASGR